MAIDALENQTSNLEWTIPDIVVRAILARKKWFEMEFRRNNERGNESKKNKEKKLKRRFRTVGNIFKRW